MHIMSQHNFFDTAIIGAGVIGASTFFHLSQNNSNICLIESNTMLSGCTNYSGGIVRCFHLKKHLIDKAIYSLNYYRDFKKNTGIDCEFMTTGFLYFPKAENILHANNLIAEYKSKKIMEWLDENQLNNKFGHLITHSQLGALYESKSGYIDPKIVTKGWIKAGINNGGHLFEMTPVKSLQKDNNHLIIIITDKGIIKAKNIVLATGPHTPFLLDTLNIQHNLYSQIIQVDIRKPTCHIKNFPAFIDDCNELNGRPDLITNHIYIGHPTYQRITNLSEIGSPDHAHSQTIIQKGLLRWQCLKNSEYIGSLRSADCYSQHGEGFVSKLNDQNIYIATGFNGGGFKFAPWIGMEMVKLIKLNN